MQSVNRRKKRKIKVIVIPVSYRRRIHKPIYKNKPYQIFFWTELGKRNHRMKLTNFNCRYEETTLAEPDPDTSAQQERQEIRNEQSAHTPAGEYVCVAHTSVANAQDPSRVSETPVLWGQLVRTAAPVTQYVGILKFITKNLNLQFQIRSVKKKDFQKICV